MSIDFQYNENACVSIKEFSNRKISEAKKEIESIKKEKEVETDPAIQYQLSIYILKKQREIEAFEEKIIEMNAILKTLKQ
jgi:hypothetical protein